MEQKQQRQGFIQRIKDKAKMVLFWLPMVAFIAFSIKIGLIDFVSQDGILAISFNYGMIW